MMLCFGTILVTAGSDAASQLMTVAGSDWIYHSDCLQGSEDFISFAICRCTIGAMSNNSRTFKVTGASRILAMLNLSWPTMP